MIRVGILLLIGFAIVVGLVSGSWGFMVFVLVVVAAGFGALTAARNLRGWTGSPAVRGFQPSAHPASEHFHQVKARAASAALRACYAAGRPVSLSGERPGDPTAMSISRELGIDPDDPSNELLWWITVGWEDGVKAWKRAGGHKSSGRPNPTSSVSPPIEVVALDPKPLQARVVPDILDPLGAVTDTTTRYTPSSGPVSGKDLRARAASAALRACYAAGREIALTGDQPGDLTPMSISRELGLDPQTTDNAALMDIARGWAKGVQDWIEATTCRPVDNRYIRLHDDVWHVTCYPYVARGYGLHQAVSRRTDAVADLLPQVPGAHPLRFDQPHAEGLVRPLPRKPRR